MRDRFIAALAAVLLALAGLTFATASPALAVGECTVDSICFYDTSTSGAFIDHDDADTSPGECLHISSTWQAKTSYIWNRTDHQYHVYISTDCTGIYGHIWANTSGAMSDPWNNSIRSYIRVG